ncbi:MAG: ABC transporter substrate-binding protein [Bifidobacteriaceae bacterium]|nr:ABC transporter substrate-binding protein [Bifidobacteriaceae bacterium]
MLVGMGACSGGSMSDSSNSSSDTYVIGSITTISGAAAAYGEAELKGFNLAISEINKAGGVNGKKLSLQNLDDKGDATEASNAFNRLSDNSSVIAVAGPTISSTTAAITPLADSAKLATIAPAATSDSIETGNYVFRACFKDSYQGEVAAKFAAENLKVKKVAVLYGTGDAYSSGTAQAFIKTAKAEGLDVVATENSSSADATEYSSQLQKIQASGAEFLYAPYYYSTAGPYIIPQARSLGFTGVIMGPDGYDGLQTSENPSAFNDVYYTTHYSPDDTSNSKVAAFIESYKKANNNNDPNTFAALGYDTIYMIKDALEKAGKDASRESVRDEIAKLNFSGVTGSFTLDKTGSPKKSVIVLKEEDGTPKYLTTVKA